MPSLDDLLKRFDDDALDRAFTSLNEPRLKEKYAKTADEVFDSWTLEALQKLISQGTLDTLDFPVKTGKEGNVFHATTPAGLPVAVKVFRVFTSTFRSHMDYILGDPRFKNVKPSKREIVYAWARKEHRNLSEILAAGVDCPTPLRVERNVLVMEWIGTEGGPAPMLKDVGLDDPQATYDYCIDALRRIYDLAGLVHGDYSEFNILMQGDLADPRIVVMDVGQAVTRTHPRAKELLARDVQNITRYFRKLGVKNDPLAIIKDLQATKEEE